jgi:hypothetical protein
MEPICPAWGRSDTCVARSPANWPRSSLCSLRSGINMLQGAYDAAFKAVLGLTEKDVVPDVAIRAGIRYLLSQRAKEVRTGTSSWWRSPRCSRQLPPPAASSCLPPPAAACRRRLPASSTEAARPGSALPCPSCCRRRPPAPARNFIAACRPFAMSWPACRWRCRWGGCALLGGPAVLSLRPVPVLMPHLPPLCLKPMQIVVLSARLSSRVCKCCPADCGSQ